MYYLTVLRKVGLGNRLLGCGAILFLLVFCGVLQSCKENDPTLENPYLNAVDVLNANSGYSKIWDKLSDPDGVIKNFVPLDITLQDGSLLNFAIGTNSNNPYIDYIRTTVDISNGSIVANPTNIGQHPINPNIRYDKIIARYFPYTNIFAIKTENYSGPQNEGFYGDILAEGGFGPEPWGVNDFAFRYPVYNSGGGEGHFSSTANNNPEIGSTFTMLRAGIGKSSNLNYYRLSCIHEVYNDNGSARFIAIGCTKDSVKVYKIDFTSLGSTTQYPEYNQTLIKSIRTDLPYFYSSVDDQTALRHYSNDGKKLAFMVTEIATGEENKTRSTYTYNFETNALAQVLDKVKLEYAGFGSDIDIDENGFIYYTGDANFGDNPNGVSVYKKTRTENSIVGADNFLKFGTIGKLKYLNGKIYLAITGNKTGTDIKQITILKQN